MSTEVTVAFQEMYFEEPEPTEFFTSMFTIKPGGVHNSAEVEIDIERSGEQISVAVHDLNTGYRINAADIFTNKMFKPPVHKEAIALNSSDMIKREPGTTINQRTFNR